MSFQDYFLTTLIGLKRKNYIFEAYAEYIENPVLHSVVGVLVRKKLLLYRSLDDFDTRIIVSENQLTSVSSSMTSTLPNGTSFSSALIHITSYIGSTSGNVPFVSEK